MKSIERAHIVVVASGDQSLRLAVHLCRIGVAQATFVASLDEARSLCLAGAADLCLVAVADWTVDAAPEPEIAAPGRERGVPSLMLARVVTPYLQRMARRCGYKAAIAAEISPQMLVRRMGAALQRGQPPRLARMHRPLAIHPGISRHLATEFVDFRKAKPH
jgi:hypothetical protein